MMQFKISPAVGLAALLLSCVPLSAQTTLLEETFPEDQRMTQDLPDTAAWYSSGTRSGIIYTEGALTSPVNRYILAYFTNDGMVSLKNGESLSLEFTFDLIKAVAGQRGFFRVALLNSGGTRIDADNARLANPVFNEYTGYAVFLHNDQPEAFYIGKRDTQNAHNFNFDKLIHSVTEPYTRLLANVGPERAFTDGNLYNGRLTLTRTQDGVDIALKVSGDGLDDFEERYLDTYQPFVDFDTVVFFGNTEAMSSYTLHRVQINHLKGR